MGRSTVTPSSFSRALGGLAALAFATVPLAIVFSLYGFLFSSEEYGLIEIVLGTAMVVIVALVLAVVSGLAIGVPVYILASRTKAPRVAVLVGAAALTGVLVHELWNGGELFEDVGSMALFAFFGAYSGAAFWLGADVWSRT